MSFDGQISLSAEMGRFIAAMPVLALDVSCAGFPEYAKRMKAWIRCAEPRDR